MEGEGRRRKGPKRRGRKGVRRREVEGRGSTQPGPTFTLVYATPLLQHQARLGLNPVLIGRFR